MKRGIITYDITVDRYRNKLSKLLCGYGERVQFSVFEFELKDDIYFKMIDEIEKLYKEYIVFAYSKGNIQDIKRSIRIYLLCEGCYKKTFIFDKVTKKKKLGMII